MICWLRSTEKLLVVRLDDDFLRIVGTAMTPENQFGFQSANVIELCFGYRNSVYSTEFRCRSRLSGPNLIFARIRESVS